MRLRFFKWFYFCFSWSSLEIGFLGKDLGVFSWRDFDEVLVDIREGDEGIR